MSFKRITQCRACGSTWLEPVLDLGMQPLANSLVPMGKIGFIEDRYPLTLATCTSCTHVQIMETVDPSVLFRDYVYFSSNSAEFVEHARRLAERMIGLKDLGPGSLVVEAASNDGYLLKHYAARGVPVLGIDPAENIARVANEAGIRTIPEFFGWKMAEGLEKCDVFHANNVIAHVHDLTDFFAGVDAVLKVGGLAVLEFPYLGDMVMNTEFDTIYHEHLSYFSATSLANIIDTWGFQVEFIERLPVHGGSLRVVLKKLEFRIPRAPSHAQEWVELLNLEKHQRLGSAKEMLKFAARVGRLGCELWRELYRAHVADEEVFAYGASAKGSTLLNTFGIDRRAVPYAFDRSPHKHGKLMPGTGTEIVPVERITEHGRPRKLKLLLLSWNFKDEIMREQADFIERGGRFIVPVPKVELLPRLGAAV